MSSSICTGGLTLPNCWQWKLLIRQDINGTLLLEWKRQENNYHLQLQIYRGKPVSVWVPDSS